MLRTTRVRTLPPHSLYSGECNLYSVAEFVCVFMTVDRSVFTKVRGSPCLLSTSEDFTAPRCTRKEMAASSVVEIIDEVLSPSEARHKIMEELKEPVVFTNMLSSSTTWEKALGLTPQSLASLVPKLRTKFKICPRIASKEYETRFKQHETVFETHCTFVEATFGDFCEWLEEPLRNESTLDKCQNRSNALLHFPKSSYWVYADYKYLCNLLAEAPALDGLTDWSIFGIGMETWDSTLWVGSDEAYTPCHCDTYGCNLVAQLSGKKTWLLFPPKDTEHLYPTRIPYEESSIFSKVNIPNPDYQQHPSYSSAIPYKVRVYTNAFTVLATRGC